MNDFHDRFEQLLKDIHQIKLDAAESKSETKVLTTRLNGTVEKMNRHLDESDERQRAIERLWVTIVLQILGLSFFAGGLVWMVRNNNCLLEEYSKHHSRFMEHIVKDEARWDYFQIYPQTKGD